MVNGLYAAPMSATIYILGPQSSIPNLPKTINRFVPTGPLGLISAGWRHSEGEFSALSRELSREIKHLPLYQWFDELGNKEPTLAARSKERQKQIKAYKAAYRLQLHSALGLWSRLQELEEDLPNIYAPDVLDGCKFVKQIDNRAIERLNDIRAQFSDLETPWKHPSVHDYYSQIKESLQGCSGLLIAGGHVALLRNRMYFFGLHQLIQEFLAEGKPVFAWSAGAMAITSRIILYYDDPPFGKGIPEVLDTGIGNIPQMIFLPHAQTRLRLNNTKRCQQFAMRFAPDICLTLEPGALLAWKDGFMHNIGDLEASKRIDETGDLKEWEVARCVH